MKNREMKKLKRKRENEKKKERGNQIGQNNEMPLLLGGGGGALLFSNPTIRKTFAPRSTTDFPEGFNRLTEHVAAHLAKLKFHLLLRNVKDFIPSHNAFRYGIVKIYLNFF
jgi:hypothetical protein